MNRKEIRNKNKELNILDNLVKLIRQYFPRLINMFGDLTDTRNQSYVKYQMKVVFMVRLMGLMCEIKSMHELTRDFNTDETVKNIASLCNLELEEIPHCDTINDVFKNIDVKELEEIRKYLINRIIRSKMMDKYKIRDKYYHIVVDGTGLATSRKKYNENCLVKNKTDKKGNEYKEYSTYVLEAKLIVGDMAFSIGTEFVENESEDVTKQDCEINAFKRLVNKIKKEYPRLKILIGADALYAKKTIFDICKQNNWKYIIRFKEGSIPTLYQEYRTIVEENNESSKTNYKYVSKIDYQGDKVNIINYEEEKDGKTTEFTYITDLSISDKNIESTIGIGRKRWKIENVGFNEQKNGIFDIEHLYSKNQNAIKVHYLLVQMAHLLMQLLRKGVKSIKELKLKIKEISQKIKNELISITQNLEVQNKIQLRFG